MITGIILFLLFGYVPIVLAFTATPLIAKKNIFFGVTIPVEQRNAPQLKKIKQFYLRYSIIFAILTLVFFFLLQPFDDKRFAIAILLATFLPMIFHTILYLYAYKKVKDIKREQGWVIEDQSAQQVFVDPAIHDQRAIYTNLWFILLFAIVMITMSHLITIYDTLPDRIITHYDITGTPDGFAEKSFMSVFGLSFVQLFMIGTFVFVNWMIKKSKQQLDPKDPQRSLQNNLRFRRLWSFFSILLCIIIVVFFSIMQLQMVYGTNSKDVSSTIIGELILTTLLIVFFIMRSLRLKREPFTKEITVTPMDQDAYWKLGGIYYNPHDPALIVEKRMGIGWTLNFARPLSWLILLGPLVLIGILIFFVESVK